MQLSDVMNEYQWLKKVKIFFIFYLFSSLYNTLFDYLTFSEA